MAMSDTRVRLSRTLGRQTPPDSRPEDAGGRAIWFWALGLAALMIAWLVLGLAFEQVRVVIRSSRAQLGVETTSAFARLAAALVLFLFPAEKAGQRLRWVASGFVVLGIGGLLFSLGLQLLGVDPDLNTLIYASLVVRTVANVFFVVGLLPRTPPPLMRPAFVITLALSVTVMVAFTTGAYLLPRMTTVDNEIVALGSSHMLGLTAWHWVVSVLPLGLAIAAVVGAVRHYRTGTLGGWLVLAMVLLAGVQLHTIIWPSPYSPVLTSAGLLRLAFAAVVAVGAFLELRRIAEEREALLASDREQIRRLTELAVLKADFTAMVAHELGNPLATVRGFAQVLATGKLGPEEQAEAFAIIQSEMNVLTALLADMQTAATVERDDFAVNLRGVRVSMLLAEASTLARSLPGDHPFTVNGSADAVVRADLYRIGQVLRNLLSNAAKYSPPGTPIELRVTVKGDRVCLEVADQGHGIHPDDLKRVFEKFGRGRDEAGRKIPGVGLGLYLSRRIIQAHGADLEVRSTPGVGSVFGFELEIVRDSRPSDR